MRVEDVGMQQSPTGKYCPYRESEAAPSQVGVRSPSGQELQGQTPWRQRGPKEVAVLYAHCSSKVAE